tara:strand:- start:251 stop:1564 length:1314 start_codon:yes stop_codon:yes gene_type:complete
MSILGTINKILAELPLPPNINAAPYALKIFEEVILPRLPEDEQARFGGGDVDVDSDQLVVDSTTTNLSDIEQATDPQPSEESSLAPQAIQEFLEAQVADGTMSPEEAQQRLMGYYAPPSRPRNTALITDIEFVNQPGGGDIVSTGFDPLGRDGLMGLQGYIPQGTIGLKDEPYFNVFAPGFSLESDELLIGTASQIDQDMVDKGFEFRRVVDEDRPFTINDGLNLYNQQSEGAKRLIAESLVPSMMKDPSLRAFALRDPNVIYDPNSIYVALTYIQEDAAEQARFLKDSPMSSGYETLDMIPALTEEELRLDDPDRANYFDNTQRSMTVKELTNVLFDQAVAMGSIKTVTKAYSDKVAGDLYRSLTGRRPDDAFFVLADLWTREAQMEKAAAGQGSLAGAEYTAMYEQNIRDEYAEEISQSETRTARDSLLKALGVR